MQNVSHTGTIGGAGHATAITGFYVGLQHDTLESAGKAAAAAAVSVETHWAVAGRAMTSGA